MRSRRNGERGWRYVDPTGRDSAWIANQQVLQTFIEYATGDVAGHSWRKTMVVTQSWLRQQLAELGSTPEQSFIAFAPMLVVVDGSESDLDAQVDAAVQSGILDLISVTS